MRSVPGFDQLLRAASGMLRERQYRLVYLSSAVRVDDRQFGDLDQLLGDVCGVLDAPERPELYVFNDPKPNAITLGVDKPFIAISSGMYELMTPKNAASCSATNLVTRCPAMRSTNRCCCTCST
jgi:hypothetical protein